MIRCIYDRKQNARPGAVTPKRAISQEPELQKDTHMIMQTAQTTKQIIAVGKSVNGSPYSVQTVPALDDTPMMTAYNVGIMDAEDKEPFAPEMFYVKKSDMYDYALGTLSIRPDCYPAQALAEKYEAEKWAEANDIEQPVADWNERSVKWTGQIEW